MCSAPVAGSNKLCLILAGWRYTQGHASEVRLIYDTRGVVFYLVSPATALSRSVGPLDGNRVCVCGCARRACVCACVRVCIHVWRVCIVCGMCVSVWYESVWYVRVCVGSCMYMCIYMFVYVYARICVSACLYICLFVCTNACLHAWLYS